MDEYSRIYAKYISKLNYDDLPPEVVEKTKMHFLDTLGNIFAAHEMPWSQAVIRLVKQMGGTPESTIAGESKYPAVNAALAMGTMAHGVDADDSGARPSWAHPGSCINPAALAVAEATGASGKQLIEGIVAGYEISCRVDSSGYPGFRHRGFHATGIAGTIGAVAAAGKIMELTEDQMANAFGIAGTQAAGLEEWLTTGDMTKRLHAGKAAMNAVIAAYLAKEGYTGPLTVFEGKYGLLNSHTDGWDEKRLTEGLGEVYKLLGCKIKRYACCHELCPPIRMTLELQKEHGIESEDVEEIRIGLNHITAENILQVAETPLHAQNHPAVAVAIALVEKKMFLREFFECYDDPRVVDLGKKASVYVDTVIDEVFPTHIGTRVTIKTKDGTYEKYEKDKPPVFNDFIKEKFHAFATTLLSEEKAEKITEMVEQLDEIDDLEKLLKLFY
jgi:2-methylcitrate dehydratase PrpD